MIKIQCTRKLTEKFDIKIKNDIICGDLFSWHAHIFNFNRKNCIIFMNNKTRYNFLIYGVTKKQICDFNNIIKENLIKNLEAENINSTKMSRYIKEFNEIEYTKTSDRRLIGQINDMIYISKYRLSSYEFLGIEELIEVNRKNNRTPMPKAEFAYSMMI